MEHPAGDELIEQGTGHRLVQAGRGRGAQHLTHVARAVEQGQPSPDRDGETGQDDRSGGVYADLEGVLVAEDAAEGGLHTWPHGRKVSTAW
ncbi:hypothetical protein HTZ77_27560 [Nonomuraea sp. SMC257]|uniref:Uncharacterized protein n=1 Tax=Nonomuraea montanisoli TaxID=2741721 RepID=A0A7Y6M611_9ACTN|nr:hypothetical protein [Nonomuraea montanisoli]NUW35161.1 hypothetical protein [Nonomuraea montanisoli]